MNKEYEELKKICNKKGCTILPQYMLHHLEANMDISLRYWIGLRYPKDSKCEKED